MPILSSYHRYGDYIVARIKEPLKKALLGLLDHRLISFLVALYRLWKVLRAVHRLPVPTKENTNSVYNTGVLIDIRDYIFARLRVPGYFYDRLYDIANGFIIIYDTHFWGRFLDVFFWEIKKSKLKPPGPQQPDPHFWDHELN